MKELSSTSLRTSLAKTKLQSLLIFVYLFQSFSFHDFLDVKEFLVVVKPFLTSAWYNLNFQERWKCFLFFEFNVFIYNKIEAAPLTEISHVFELPNLLISRFLTARKLWSAFGLTKKFICFEKKQIPVQMK